jgi:hypothetical protein
MTNLKTYVKIYGPPLMEALDELQKIAAKMPKITQYHFLVAYSGAPFASYGGTPLGEPNPVDAALVPGSTSTVEKVKEPLISKSGHTLGEHDFFFEWSEEPTWHEMRELISKIDKAFSRLGCKYTLTSK